MTENIGDKCPSFSVLFLCSLPLCLLSSSFYDVIAGRSIIYSFISLTTSSTTFNPLQAPHNPLHVRHALFYNASEDFADQVQPLDHWRVLPRPSTHSRSRCEGEQETSIGNKGDHDPHWKGSKLFNQHSTRLGVTLRPRTHLPTRLYSPNISTLADQRVSISIPDSMHWSTRIHLSNFRIGLAARF